jgi:hypothetical protein
MTQILYDKRKLTITKRGLSFPTLTLPNMGKKKEKLIPKDEKFKNCDSNITLQTTHTS